MTPYKLLTGLALIVAALVVTLIFTKYDYGHNIWQRYCNQPADFSTKSICKEVTLKKEAQSQALQEQDYLYLSVRLPITHYSYDYKNPRFDFPSLIFSTTLSYARYALSHPRFYVDYLIVLLIVFCGYFLLSRFMLKTSNPNHES
jgi:hypothetical protein